MNMKWIREKFEAMSMAVAFAEAGEWDAAKEFVQQGPRKKQQKQDQAKQSRPRPRSVRT